MRPEKVTLTRVQVEQVSEALKQRDLAQLELNRTLSVVIGYHGIDDQSVAGTALQPDGTLHLRYHKNEPITNAT